MSFLVKIREKARTVGKRVVLPEGTDERVITAAAKIVELGVAKPIVLGHKEDMERVANDLGISLKGVEIIEIAKSDRVVAYATKFAELRAKKGMTYEKAREIMTKDPNFYGAMMVKMGDADAMVSGSDSPTADVLRAGLQVIGTKKGIKTVSSMFVMELTERQDTYGEVLLFGDCSVIPVPTSEQLADIAEASVVTAKSVVGMEGKVALLTFSTKGSASHPDIDVVIEAGKILEERGVKFPFTAEVQADAAIVKSVAMKKCPDSKVAGTANILVFPNLAAGNIGYKLVQRLAGANAYGPLIQGLASPINDLSRGCSVDDIVNLVAITAVQAAE